MFKNIFGHENLLMHLSKLADRSGTYLFSGSQSVGKKTVASELARYQLCIEKKDDECPCQSCRLFGNDHPDLMMIGRSGRIKVEDINCLHEFLTTAPFLSPIKAVILDNADSMTWEAANGLLKALEEVQGVSFFIITSKPEAILPTILSRCIKYQFSALNKEDLINVLHKRMGFDIPSASIIGGIGVSTGMDVFSVAGSCLSQRDQALKLIIDLNTMGMVDVLEYADRIDRDNILVFTNLLMLLMMDMIFLIDGVKGIVNVDKQKDLEDSSKRFNKKSLAITAGFLSQVNKYGSLNANVSFALKTALVKSYPVLKI